MSPETEAATGGILIRPLTPEHFPAVCAMVKRLFDAFIAADATPGGRRLFREQTRPAALAERIAAGHRYAVALVRGAPVGVVGVGERHLYWLFVDAAHHRRGIARRLLEHALRRLPEGGPDPDRLTVFASTYAVPAYRRLGFRVTGETGLRHGVTVTPMVMVLPPGPQVPGPGLC